MLTQVMLMLAINVIAVATTIRIITTTWRRGGNLVPPFFVLWAVALNVGWMGGQLMK